MLTTRGALALLLAGLLTTASARAEDDAQAALDEVARARVILLVEVDHRDTKAFSGMAGSTFWFRVKEVLRFEAEAAMQPNTLWHHNHQIMVAHNRSLARTNLLEWSLLYPDDDDGAKREDAALTGRFQPGRTFVLATPTTAWFSATGEVVPGKWGQLCEERGQPRFVDADAETVQAVRDRLGEPDRAPPYTPPPPPKAPRPDPSQGRGDLEDYGSVRK